jgi:hypothetical protein
LILEHRNRKLQQSMDPCRPEASKLYPFFGDRWMHRNRKLHGAASVALDQHGQAKTRPQIRPGDGAALVALESLFWSQFGRPQPDDKKQQQAFLGSIRPASGPAMIAVAATLFCSQFGRPQPDDECSSSQLLLGSIPAASYLQRGGQPQNSIFWSQFGRRGFSLAMNAAAATLF